jgi:hypothetical protein
MKNPLINWDNETLLQNVVLVNAAQCR